MMPRGAFREVATRTPRAADARAAAPNATRRAAGAMQAPGRMPPPNMQNSMRPPAAAPMASRVPGMPPPAIPAPQSGMRPPGPSGPPMTMRQQAAAPGSAPPPPMQTQVPMQAPPTMQTSSVAGAAPSAPLPGMKRGGLVRRGFGKARGA